MSKRELSRKRILADAKLIVEGSTAEIVNGELGKDMSNSDKQWYRGYLTAWQDLQYGIEHGAYDK